MSHRDAVQRAGEALCKSAATAAACHWRPAYHFAAPAGWINDPNGMIHLGGVHHLFYQHYPYASHWGPMHWGHATSEDLIHWQHLPVALAPSESYEIAAAGGGGCWSGSAVAHERKLILMYTAESADQNPRQQQCIATSTDGVTFSKHPANPVIRNFPREGSADFRDPRIWRHEDWFYALIGSGKDGVGKVLLYRSHDLEHWDYLGVPVQSDGSQGQVWECPDLFELDGQHVLLFSPTGLGRPLSMYMVGRFDYGTHRFTSTSSGLIDNGSDFYAPQTLRDPFGRRIMIGWMQAWGAKVPTERNGWSGAMSMPRELHIVGGRLVQFPTREIERIRREQKKGRVTVGAGKVVPIDMPGDSVELRLNITPGHGCVSAGAHVRSSPVQGQFTAIRWNARGELTLDRTRSGEGDKDVRTAPCRRADIRIFVDRSSVEVFAADGTSVLTSRVYPSSASLGIELFSSDGDATIEYSCWRLCP